MIHAYQRCRITIPDTEMRPDHPTAFTDLSSSESYSDFEGGWGQAQTRSNYDWVTRSGLHNRTGHGLANRYRGAYRTRVRS